MRFRRSKVWSGRRRRAGCRPPRRGGDQVTVSSTQACVHCKVKSTTYQMCAGCRGAGASLGGRRSRSAELENPGERAHGLRAREDETPRLGNVARHVASRQHLPTKQGCGPWRIHRSYERRKEKKNKSRGRRARAASPRMRQEGGGGAGTGAGEGEKGREAQGAAGRAERGRGRGGGQRRPPIPLQPPARPRAAGLRGWRLAGGRRRCCRSAPPKLTSSWHRPLRPCCINLSRCRPDAALCHRGREPGGAISPPARLPWPVPPVRRASG